MELYKETAETESDQRKRIFNVLAELNAPLHPADNMTDNNPGNPGNPGNAGNAGNAGNNKPEFVFE